MFIALSLALAAPADPHHVITSAFDIPLGSSAGDLAARGFTQPYVSRDAWETEEDSFFERIMVILESRGDKVLSILASRHYLGGTAKQQIDECKLDLDFISATIIGKYPTLKLETSVNYKVVDNDARAQDGLKKRFQEVRAIGSTASDARAIEVSCTDSSEINGAKQVTSLLVTYRVSDLEYDQAGARLRLKLQAEQWARAVSRGLDPSKF